METDDETQNGAVLAVVPDERRPRDQRRDLAYLRWATSPDKGSKGLLTQIALEVGVAASTLYGWKKEDDWTTRWVNDVQGAKLTMLREGEAVLLTALRPGLERLGQIARLGADRDAIQAMKLLAAILGIDQSKAVHLSLTTINPVLVTSAKETALGEMRDLLAAAGQTNIETARSAQRRS